MKRIPQLDTRKRKPESPHVKATRQERGYTDRWLRLSKQFLTEHPLCEDCDANGITEAATEVDHVDGLGPNGPRGFDETNLRALCKVCHAKKTRRSTGAGPLRVVRGPCQVRSEEEQRAGAEAYREMQNKLASKHKRRKAETTMPGETDWDSYAAGMG
jgi:5-methylcytosine-specific restriction protein A